MENIPNINHLTESKYVTVNDEDIPHIKKGIKLPKSNFQWSTANDYFKFKLQSNQPITSQDLNTSKKLLNDIIYDYFADTCSSPENSLVKNYKDCTIKDLKKAPKTLKSTTTDADEIKYVSHILRAKLRVSESNADTNHGNDESLNHDKCIRNNFWGYVKKVLNKKDSVLPSFDMKHCITYFTKSLAAFHPNKLFNIPSWIPLLSDPVIQFDLDPPSYQQVTSIIGKMKPSGSPCPLNQPSIICFKRCPFLRSYLTDLIRAVWQFGIIP